MAGRVESPGSRARLLPASGIPLLYFAFAHGALILAFAILTVHPSLPAGFFHHPRMIAVVHLLTLGWISASILGAFYIVGPLALRMPMRPGPMDRLAFAAFALGVGGMVAHFWMGEYTGMAWSALPVAAAVLHVAIRAWRGLGGAPVPWPVKLHVSLAFANMLSATTLGIVLGIDRVTGWLAWPPMPSAFAHAHLAAIGWAMMMVMGLSYRLVPMILPAAMPTGPSMAGSALLVELGLIVLVVSLVAVRPWTFLAAGVIIAGVASFLWELRRIFTRKLPPPAALPQPDWATWQTRSAFLWLALAALLGILLTLPIAPEWIIPIGWVYGTAGLVGFLAQIVVGIQGRLLPLHGWYRLFEAAGMQPPPRSAHTLASHALAKWILIAWALGVPVLAAGLATHTNFLVSAGSAALLAGVSLNAAQAWTIATGATVERLPSKPK